MDTTHTCEAVASPVGGRAPSARRLKRRGAMFPRVHLIATGVTSLALLAGTALADTNGADRQFADEAYSINKGEIELGQMARQKGTAPEVKAFGERMVQDHTNGLRDLETAAREAGVALPHALQPSEAQLEAELTGLSAKAFDDAYMKHMVAGHGLAITVFKDEIANGASPSLRAYAKKTLPMLESHENNARTDRSTMQQRGQ